MNTLRMYFAWFMGECLGRRRWHCVRAVGGGDFKTGYMTETEVRAHIGRMNGEVMFIDVEHRTLMYRSRGG